MPIRDFVQRITDKYMALKAKNGMFVYGSKFWTYYLEKDKEIFDDYMAMNLPIERGTMT